MDPCKATQGARHFPRGFSQPARAIRACDYNMDINHCYIDVCIYQLSRDSGEVQGRAYIRFCYLQKKGRRFRKLVYKVPKNAKSCPC